MDPITTTEGETYRVTENIFETLLDYGPQDTVVRPGLAEKWEVSKDGLTYTFHLRQGVKFHDGTDFNADAVVFNFDRWMNGDADKFPYYTMFGGFKKDKGHVIKEVKAVDANTVQFVLKRPQAPFLKNLAMSPFGIASPAAVKNMVINSENIQLEQVHLSLLSGNKMTGSFLKRIQTTGKKAYLS